MPINKLNIIEKNYIALASNHEKKYIEELYHSFLQDPFAEKYGLNRYFNLWYGILFSDDKEKSREIFDKTLKSGISQERINYFF